MRRNENSIKLSAYNRWRRDGRGMQPPEAGALLDWAIAVVDAADALVNGKDKHPERAYARLEAAVNAPVVSVGAAVSERLSA